MEYKRGELIGSSNIESKESLIEYKDIVMRGDIYNIIENKELEVYYQPQVLINSSEIIGTELLLRWNHPIWGLIYPVEFLEIAKETKMIFPIGSWVLSQICKTYKEWLEKGYKNIDITVNLSSVQMTEKGFISELKEILKFYGLKPNFLIFEIKESMLLDECQNIALDINELRSMGIRIALGGFGTVYSSFYYLSTFDIDILKIDRFFIRKIKEGDRNKRLIKAMINFGENLGIDIVSEGIETLEELLFLKIANCNIGQGHLYSKEVSQPVFEKLLNKKILIPRASKASSKWEIKNRRKFFRVEFTDYLEGDMKILEVQGMKLNLGSTPILIKDMSAEGLSFISDINIPTKKDIVFEFETNLFGETISVIGNSVWSKEIKKGIREYGVQLYTDENTKMDIIRILNKTQVFLKKRFSKPFKGNFVEVSPCLYFKMKRNKLGNDHNQKDKKAN